MSLRRISISRKAQWEEAKISPKARQERMQAERGKQIVAAKERTAAANERIAHAKKCKIRSRMKIGSYRAEALWLFIFWGAGKGWLNYG